MRRSACSALLVILAGLGGLAWGTDGFRAVTAEGARRAQVLAQPRPLPEVALQDQDGRSFRLQDYHGQQVAVEFIYTRCETLCQSLGIAFRQLHDRLPPQRLGRDISLLSISFDAARDAPAQLREYAQRHGADGTRWRVARIRDAARVAPVLAAFGVVAIPDGRGGYEHNAAIHLVDASGRLARIADIDQPAAFADELARAP